MHQKTFGVLLQAEKAFRKTGGADKLHYYKL